jgi:hypothetical protein
MAKGKRQGLPRVAAAVRRRRLAGCHIVQLRAKIADVQKVGAEGRFARLALRNLRVADTQLREIALRSGGAVFDERALAALPRQLRRRIVMRLDNIGRRMADARGHAIREQPRDPAFRCVREYERCKEEVRSARFWCHIAMVVCLAGSMLRR